MTAKRHIQILATAAPALLLAGCSSMEFTHVKPGHSARADIEFRQNPPPPASVVSVPGAMPVPAGTAGIESAPLPLPPPPMDILPAPELPDPSNTGDRVAELYTKGSFAMKAGKTEEAIAALEEAVKLDPNFADAWTKLVMLYQAAGRQEKAIEAYKKAKQLGQPQGSGGGASFPGGLGLAN